MTDSPRTDPLLPMVTEIVVAYLSHNTVAMTDIPRLIAETRQALARDWASAGAEASGRHGNGRLANDHNGAEAGRAVGDPAIAIRKSVTPDHIICLEDGMKLKMLKRHLRTAYDMSPEQYRRKWGLPADYPMVAPNYAKKRSSLARQFGLGRKPSGKGTGAKGASAKGTGTKGTGRGRKARA